jgi:putative flippase GtrA
LYTDNRKEFVRFVKFAIVGAVGAAIDFGVLNLMHKGFDWPLLWANTLSVSIAIASNFTWNRLWTHPDRAPVANAGSFPVHLISCRPGHQQSDRGWAGGGL